MCTVAWSGHRKDKQRNAKSFLFAEKNKTLKNLRVEHGNCCCTIFYSSYIRCTQYSFVAKNAQHHVLEDLALVEFATAFCIVLKSKIERGCGSRGIEVTYFGL